MTDYTSSQSGSWNAAATWGGGGFPILGDKATIQSGHVVTIDSDAAVGTDTLPVPTTDDTIKYDLVILGSLKWDYTPAADYTFTIDGHTLVGPSGLFEIGRQPNPIPDDKKASLYFPAGIAVRYIVLAETTSIFRVYGSATAHRADAVSQRTTVKTAFTMGTNRIVVFNDDVDYEVGDVVLLAMGGDKTKRMVGVNTVHTPFPLLSVGISSGSDVQFRINKIYDYWAPGDKVFFDDGANSEIVEIKTQFDPDEYTADFVYAHLANTPIYYYGEEKVVIQNKINASTYTVNSNRNHMAGDMAIHWERNVVFEGEINAGPLVTSFGDNFKIDINWTSFIAPAAGTIYAPSYRYQATGDWKIKNVIADHGDNPGYFMRFSYSGETNINEVGIDEVHMFRSKCIYCYNNVGNISLGHLSGIKCTRPVVNADTVGATSSVALYIGGVWYTGDATVSYAKALYQEGNGSVGYIKTHYTLQSSVYLSGNGDRGFMHFSLGGGEIHNGNRGIHTAGNNISMDVKDVQIAQISLDGYYTVSVNFNKLRMFNCAFDACNLQGDSIGALGICVTTNGAGMRSYDICECDFGMTLQNYKANVFTNSNDLLAGSRIILDKCRFRKPISSLSNAGLENELSWAIGSNAFTGISIRQRWNNDCTLEMIEPEVYSVNDADSYWDFTGGATKDVMTLEGDVAQDFDPAQNTNSFTVIGRIYPASVIKNAGVMSKWNEADDKRGWKVYQVNSDIKFAVSKSGLAGGDVTEITQGGMTIAEHFFCARYTYVGDGTSIMKLDVDGVETTSSVAVGPVYSSELADVKIADNVVDETDYYDGRFYLLAYVNRAISDVEKDDVRTGAANIATINPDSALDFGRGQYANARYPSDIGAHWFRVGLYGQTPAAGGTLGSKLDNVDVWATNKNVAHFAITGGGGTVQDEAVEIIDNTFAVKMHPFTEAARNSGTQAQPLLLPVNAGQTITVKLSIKKNKAVAVGKRPAIFLQGLGIIDEAESSAIVNAWEELTVTGTAVTKGMVKFWVSQGANEYDAEGATTATLFPKSPDNITVYADGLVVTRS